MICKKRFVSQRTYDAHMDKRHTSNEWTEKFTCLLCKGIGKVIHRSGLLESHMKNVHKKVEFKCRVCSREFKRKGALTEHERYIHSDFEVECKYCGKLFRSNQALNAHIRSKREKGESDHVEKEEEYHV